MGLTKRILVGLSIVFAMLLSTLPAMGTPTAASGTVATGINVPMAVTPAINATNSRYSTHSVLVYTKSDGRGTGTWLRPGNSSTYKVKSVYGERGCFTVVNVHKVVPQGVTYNFPWYMTKANILKTC